MQGSGREMNVTMGLVGDKELQKQLKNICKEKVDKVKKETYTSALEVQKKAKDNLKSAKSWDTGHLANTILAEPSTDRSIVEIGPTAPYGPYVEYGTKPHFPPPDALEDWAKRHGFESAWPICIVIAKRGIPAKPYLLPAYLAIVDRFFNRLKRIAAQ